MAIVNGTGAADFIHRADDGRTVPPGFNEVTGVTADSDMIEGGDGSDIIYGDAGDDLIAGGLGADTILGEDGNDNATVDIGATGADADYINLSTGADVIRVNAETATNVRLTFTSAEVGNGNTNDSGALANQDGKLAVRLQAEIDGLPAGAVTRTDDEGITFVGNDSVTFDVRDLVSGAARGEAFEVVTLGTINSDRLSSVLAGRPYYINGGQGLDTISGGDANDFLVGGAGNDTLVGGLGNDSFIGGGGNDVIRGGDGDDVAIFNITTDGGDRVNLDGGNDVVQVNANAATNVRLTFTSAEVGNGNALDSGALANQDGGFALRMRAENGSGVPFGSQGRYDDEGITFVGGAGVTFDVRDLVSGAARGEAFEVVTLGTDASETLTAIDEARPYYINAGMGQDTVSGGTANDFLVGGAGNDKLAGAEGNDSLLGGGGNDVLRGGVGADVAIYNVSTDGADRVNLDEGSDAVNVSAAAGVEQVRLTFTSAEVGNDAPLDSGALANQDGGFAVRMRAENGLDQQTGAMSRYDDEGITFVASTPGVTFDVRDLVSGTARGDGFEVVTLGTSAGEALSAVQASRAYYINAGMGDDTVTGGEVRDFLVGGAGADELDGLDGHDSMIGGGGADVFSFSTTIGVGAVNIDSILDFSVADDTVRLDSAVFTGLTPGALSADAFNTGTAASDATDRIIYDSVSGRLLFDQDGSGSAFAAVRFANIGTGLGLTEADFVVV